MAQDPERMAREVSTQENMQGREGAPPAVSTSDIPVDLRNERFVTLSVGGNVDMDQTHPTEANPEARG